jgi:hypothetical protein
MSVQSAIKRKTAPDIRPRKSGEPIVMLTSIMRIPQPWWIATATSFWSAIQGYASDVRSRAFPGPEHVYEMKKG